MTYIALLRGINVGGSNLLPMRELVSIATALKLRKARTYIQSGNLLCETDQSEIQVAQVLSQALAAKLGKSVAVLVRSADELETVLSKNPFAEKDPRYTMAVFLSSQPPALAEAQQQGPAGERIVPGPRVLYVHYPEGMGKSKLKLPPVAQEGTARNINTVTKLFAMAQEHR